MGSLTPLTPRKGAAMSRDDLWHVRALEVMLQVTDAVTTAGDPNSALSRLAKLALKATGADRSAIFVLGGDRHPRLIPAAGASSRGDADHLRRRFARMQPIELGDRLDRLRDMQGVVALDDACSSDAIPTQWRDAWRSRSLAYAPIRAAGDLFGVLAIDYVVSEHEFLPEETHLIEAIAGAAGMALRSANLIQQVRRAAEVERRLGECTGALQSGRGLPEVLDLVADRFESLLPGISCAIYILSPKGESLRLAAYRGLEPRPHIVLNELPRAGLARIQATWARDPHAPILIPDAHEGSEWDDLIPAEIGTGLLIPLNADEEVIGVVTIGRRELPFIAEDVRTAVAFAGHAAIAVARARLNDSLRAKLTLNEALVTLSETITRTSTLRSVLARLNRDVCARVGIRCVRLSFADAEVAALLGASEIDEIERKILRNWRSTKSEVFVTENDLTGLPVSLEGKIAGVLWVRIATEDMIASQVADALRVALGEIASKAKLRMVGEDRARRLAVAAERERIARDVHESVGQTFYGIGVMLEDAMRRTGDRELSSRLGAIRTLATQGISDMRGAVHALSYLRVIEYGLVGAIRDLLKEFEGTSGIVAESIIRGDPAGLNESVAHSIFRITQEMLTNLEPHGRATGVVLSLAIGEERVEYSMRDDGVGLGQRDAADWHSSTYFGLRLMATMVEEAGGAFRVVEEQPRGVSIRATFPSHPSSRREAPLVVGHMAKP